MAHLCSNNCTMCHILSSVASFLHNTLNVTLVTFTIQHVTLWWSCTPSNTPQLTSVCSCHFFANVVKFDYHNIVVTIHKMPLLLQALHDAVVSPPVDLLDFHRQHYLQTCGASKQVALHLQLFWHLHSFCPYRQ